jgi:hypothetical protein
LDSPHVAYPFRFTSLGVSTVEDSTLDEYASIAVYAIRTPLGWWPQLPAFGCVDPAGSTQPGVFVQDAITRADQRIASLTSEQRSTLDGTVSRVLTTLAQREGGS